MLNAVNGRKVDVQDSGDKDDSQPFQLYTFAAPSSSDSAASNVRFVVGDFLEFKPEQLGEAQFDAAFDRGGLVAIEPADRSA